MFFCLLFAVVFIHWEIFEKNENKNNTTSRDLHSIEIASGKGYFKQNRNTTETGKLS